MSNKYTIRYLPVAGDDLLSIYDWIAGDSLARATIFTEKLDKLIGALASYPPLRSLSRELFAERANL